MRITCYWITCRVLVGFKQSIKSRLNIDTILDFPHKSTEKFWTSGTDLGSEGLFYYFSTGQPVNNVSFQGGIGSGAELENCLAISQSKAAENYTFTRENCLSELNFICEDLPSKSYQKPPEIPKKPEPVEEPEIVEDEGDTIKFPAPEKPENKTQIEETDDPDKIDDVFIRIDDEQKTPNL